MVTYLVYSGLIKSVYVLVLMFKCQKNKQCKGVDCFIVSLSRGRVNNNTKLFISKEGGGVKKLVFIAVVAITFCQSTIAQMTFADSLSLNTGIIITDSDGKDYDIDALRKEGKHVVLHQTTVGWPCNSFGEGHNDAFEEFGSNTGDAIFIVIMMEDRDVQDLVDDYVAQSGATPIFQMRINYCLIKRD